MRIRTVPAGVSALYGADGMTGKLRTMYSLTFTLKLLFVSMAISHTIPIANDTTIDTLIEAKH